MKRTIHFARHGQTIWHAENRYAGISDIPLTSRGREQAGLLASWADTASLALVASSSLVRAFGTAAEVADVAGIPHTVHTGLREIDFGQAEGLTRAEMRGRFPEALDAFLAAPATSPLPAGEPGTVAVHRFLSAVLDTVGPVPVGDSVLIVAHTTVIRLALCHLLGLPVNEHRARFPELGNVTLTTIQVPPDVSVSELAGTGAMIRYNSPIS